MTRQPPPRRDLADRPPVRRRWARGLAGVAAFATVATTFVPAAAAISARTADGTAVTVPAAASSGVRLPTAPTFEQLLADLAAALTIPQLIADAAIAKAEYLAARVAWRLGRQCDAARHLRTASDALQHALSIAPEALRPPIRRLAEGTLRLERDVVTAAPEGCNRPDVYAVDSQLRPSVAAVTDEVTGEALTIGALDDGDGEPMEFVTNRLLLETDDPAKVAGFRARFGGTVTDSVAPDPADAGEVGTLHAIRMDPGRLLDTSRLPADMEALDPGWGGDVYLTSDAQTGRLIATAARAELEGFQVELDLVAAGHGIPDGRTDDLQPGAVQSEYDENAFNWNAFRDGSAADTEVTTAWQTLAAAGALDNKVRLAVIDSGFSNDYLAEYPADLVATDTGGVNTGPWDRNRNEDADPWHGTLVTDVFAGRVDNELPAAGVAGPVAGRTTLVNMGGRTILSVTRAVRRLDRDNTDVLNISLSAQRKGRFLRVALNTSERVIRRAVGDGMITVASAGNDGNDIDARKCRPVRGCRDKAVTAPCEFDRVICVGALAIDSRRAADWSNHGGDDVDLWAPGEDVWQTDTPGCGCVARRAAGTSFASPFVAGVAALIKAADPSLSWSEVQGVLRRTARPGEGSRATRIVHAGGAVREAFGAPFVTVTAPTPDQSFPYGDTVTGRLDVAGNTLGAPDIVWRVGESVIGRGSSPQLNLPVGTSMVTATATFPDGTVRTAVVRVRREMPPATWAITSPAAGAQVSLRTARGAGIRFTTEPAGPGVQWFLDGQAAPFATGSSVVQAFPGIAEGQHTAEARVTAPDGSRAVSRTVAFTVVPDPAERTTVAISSPRPGEEIAALGLADVPLQAAASDLIPAPAGGCPAGSAPVGEECASPTTGTYEWVVQSVRTGQVVARASGPTATVTIGSDNYVAIVTVVKGGTIVATASVPFEVFQQPI
jgi:serine protease